jgi:hypothetical protein
MPQAALVPILSAAIPAVVGGATALGAAALNKPKGPKKLSDKRRQALGSFASRLASQEEELDKQQAANRDSILLRPGSRPIRFGSQQPSSIRGPLTFR